MLVALRMKERVVMRILVRVRVMDGEYDDEGCGEGGDGEDGGMVKDAVCGVLATDR